MFSTIYAADVLFRHETRARAREHTLLVSIRERRRAEAVAVRPAVRTAAHVAVSRDETIRAAERPGLLTWPRPIGVVRCEAAACSVA